ncbi:MAG: hypothetical protein WB723_00745 [Candidatus Acidiferrales bacterium]
MSKEDLPKFDRLRSAFHADLKPEGAVQEFVVDDLVACGWMMTRSLGHEQVSIHKLVGASTNEAACAESPQPPARWSRQTRLKFIERIRSQVDDGVVISKSAELKKQITETLGENICKTLSDWESDSPAASAIAHAMVEKCEMFKMGLPEPLRGIKGERDPLTTGLYRQLIGKLLDQEVRNLLCDGGGGQTPEEQVQQTDLFMRYDVTKRRNFYQTRGPGRKGNRAVMARGRSRNSCEFAFVAASRE